MFRGLARALEDAIANAVGRTTARELGRSIEGWWGWGPLFLALIVAVLAFLVFRALGLRREKTFAALVGLAVFTMAAGLPLLATQLDHARLERIASQEVRNALIDPSSADIDLTLIRNLANGDTTLCGWVNARARNGAYQGPQVFAVRLQRNENPLTIIDPACPRRSWPDHRSECLRTTHEAASRLTLGERASNYCPLNAVGPR